MEVRNPIVSASNYLALVEAGMSETAALRFQKQWDNKCAEVQRLNSISYAAIETAVKDVLSTEKWPINRTYDDSGLSERNYTRFAAEVLTKIRHNLERGDQA